MQSSEASGEADQIVVMEHISSPLHDEDNEPDQTRKKRRRTVQACEECRDRKRKCDGMRPVCGSCSRRPGRCIWNDHRNTKGWSNNYVESLRSRIRKLESKLTTAQQGDDQTTVTQQSEQSATEAGGIASVNSHTESANIGITLGANNSTRDEQVLHDMLLPDPPLELGNVAASDPSLAAPISPSPSPSVFAPPSLGLSKPQALRTHRPINVERPNDGAEDDSDGDSSDNGSLDAVGSDSFVEGLDAMGVVHPTADSATGRPRRPSGYFGPSSTVSLLGDAFSAIKQRAFWNGSSPSGSWDSGAADLHDDATNAPGKTMRHHAVHSREDNKSQSNFSGLRYTIPIRAEADELVDSYWTWVHSLYPFLHMPSFLERYRSIWASTKDRQPSGLSSAQSRHPTNYYEGMSAKLFHCMLNVVFAMGALFNPSIALQDRDSVSRAYFNRGKALVDLDELACGSTALVQILLLMGQYLQSTDAASSCWNIVGLAIRVGQGIGLHHEPECCRGITCASGHHSQLEREIRRRTWTCSIILDRVLSLTYGRPMMIHPTMTRNRLCLPEAIDDEYLTGPGQSPGKQPPDTVSLMGCYIEAVRLQDIIGQFLAPINQAGFDNLPDPKAGSGRVLSWYEKGNFDMKMILEIERCLDDWRHKLPIYLRTKTYKNGHSAGLKQSPHRLMLLERQANVLTTRFLHARLTLLRPALSILCQAPSYEAEGIDEYDFTASSMTREVVIKGANMCLSATEALVKLMTTNMDPQADRLSAPWYNVFYIHSCAIVLLLGYLCTPSYITCMDKSSLTSAYNQCVAFLRAYRPISRSARRCSKVLTVIQNQVFCQPNGDANCNSNESNNNTTDWRPDFFPIEPPDLQAMMIPLCDQTQPHDMMAPTFPTGEAPFQSNLGWIGDTNDMAWLSLVPFLGDSEQTIIS